jgi:AI-2 transport protein TqsA
MDESSPIPQSPGFLLSAAAVVIIVAGMRAAQSLVVPFLLAGFISIIFAQPLIWLRSKGVPTWLALIIIVIAIACLGLFFAVVIGDSIATFTDNLPFYQTRIEGIMESLQGWLQGIGVQIPADILSSYLDVGAVMSIAAGMLSSIGNLLTNGFMIILTVIFILLEAVSLGPKFRAALHGRKYKMSQVQNLTQSINKYMGIKTLTSLATGIVVTVWLAILGVDFPLLWGLLAFLLNYVPSIGSIIAAIPAVLLALIQLGVWPAILAAIGYLVVNNVIGTFLEPRIMGHRVGLSTLVVFISLVFWGWVLGPIGMFLSVPLTMIIKLVLQENKGTRGLAILLDSETPAESGPESSAST